MPRNAAICTAVLVFGRVATQRAWAQAWKLRTAREGRAAVDPRAHPSLDSSSEYSVYVVSGPRIDRIVEHRLGRSRLDDMPWHPLSIDQKECAVVPRPRCACCMLWVTITMVMSSLSSRIVSSITLVDIGSRAEHGSSMRRTLGRTARDRAMQSRLELTAGERGAGLVEPVASLLPQTGSFESTPSPGHRDSAPWSPRVAGPTARSGRWSWTGRDWGAGTPCRYAGGSGLPAASGRRYPPRRAPRLRPGLRSVPAHASG